MTALDEEQRLARMREVWTGAAPSAFEVVTARQRYASRARAARVPRWAWDLSLGAGLAGALLLVYNGLTAQSGTATQVERATPAGESPALLAGQPAPSSAGAEALPAVAREASSGAASIERDGVVLAVVPGRQYEVVSGEQVVVVVNGERSVIVGPKVVEFTLETDRAAGFVLHVSPKRGAAPAEPPAPKGQGLPKKVSAAAPSETEQQSAWAQAAEAMRRGDRAQAEAALVLLTRSSEGATSDAAELALAQLWLARGEAQRAAPVLRRLSERGGTPLVRRRAAELLAGP